MEDLLLLRVEGDESRGTVMSEVFEGVGAGYGTIFLHFCPDKGWAVGLGTVAGSLAHPTLLIRHSSPSLLDGSGAPVVAPGRLDGLRHEGALGLLLQSVLPTLSEYFLVVF